MGGVSIPLMMTNKLRWELNHVGYSKEEIKNMTPEQGWEIINRDVPKKSSRELGSNQ